MLSSIGLPVWIAALLIAVEPLIDIARTALNVTDAFVANLVTARIHKQLDVAAYNSPESQLVDEQPVVVEGERRVAQQEPAAGPLTAQADGGAQLLKPQNAQRTQRPL